MRKSKILLSLATVLLIACEGLHEDKPAIPKDCVLSLSTNMNSMTKTVHTGTYLPDGESLGVTILDEVGYDYDAKGFFNVKYTSHGEEDSQVWIPEKETILSHTNAILYTYYPYSPDVTDITKVTYNIESQGDLMWAEPVTGLNATNNKAQITLNHVLAAIRLNITRGTYEGTGKITGIRLTGDGFANTATLNVKTGAMTVGDTNIGEYSCSVNNTLGTSAKVFEYVVVPRALASHISIFIEIDGLLFKSVTEQITLAQNSLTSIDVVINKTQSDVTKATLSAWNEASLGECPSEEDPLSSLLKAKCLISSTSSTSILYSTSNAAKLYVDNIEVTPATSYTFKTKGEHELAIELTDPTKLTYLFRGRSILSSVKIPETITTIDAYAFYGCSRLTELTLPENVTSIGNYVFNGCSKLISITSLNPVAPAIGSSVFNYAVTVTVPTGATGYDAWVTKYPNYVTIQYSDNLI